MSLDNEARGLEAEALPWPVVRAMVLLRDEFTCAMCGTYATQVDHILARAHGGSDHPRNLQAACKPCNQSKGNWLPSERPRFYAHLTLDQVRLLGEEMAEAHHTVTLEYRVLRQRCVDLQTGEAQPGDSLDVDRYSAAAISEAVL